MSETAAPPSYPLRECREQRGMRADEVALIGSRLTPHFPTTGEGVLNIERRGTTNFHIISALATIYRKRLSVMAAIADPERVRAN